MGTQDVRELLGTMEQLQTTMDLGLGDRPTLLAALAGTQKRLQIILDTTCPECQGHGWRYRAGSGEPDDPPDEVQCELCQGTGQLDPRWAKATKGMMYCQGCGKWRQSAMGPKTHDLLCIACWHRECMSEKTSEFAVVKLHDMGFNPNNLAFYMTIEPVGGESAYRLFFVGSEAIMRLTGVEARRFELWLRQRALWIAT
jgi:hypothetical protein